MPYKDRLEIRLTSEEKELLRKAAHSREVTLAEWARRVLLATAKATLGEKDE